MFELVLIDDKREVVEGLSRAIDWKAMQVSVHGFFSASEAMAYCMEHPPALVITSPEGEGFGTTRLASPKRPPDCR